MEGAAERCPEFCNQSMASKNRDSKFQQSAAPRSNATPSPPTAHPPQSHLQISAGMGRSAAWVSGGGRSGASSLRTPLMSTS